MAIWTRRKSIPPPSSVGSSSPLSATDLWILSAMKASKADAHASWLGEISGERRTIVFSEGSCWKLSTARIRSCPSSVGFLMGQLTSKSTKRVLTRSLLAACSSPTRAPPSAPKKRVQSSGERTTIFSQSRGRTSLENPLETRRRWTAPGSGETRVD